MPLAARRMARRGVVGPAPVARTAAVVGTAAVVSHGVARRSDRRDDRRATDADRGSPDVTPLITRSEETVGPFETSGHVRKVTGVSGSAYVIEYDGTFTFPVSAAQLWATMIEVDRFSSWWGWLHEFSVEGNGVAHGTVLHGVVEPPLPYRMRLDVVVDECVPERRITALVHGDLEGTARITLHGNDAERSAHATWTIEMMQRPMRLAARVAPPLLRWGHDRVVDATVDTFRHQLLA